MNPYTAPDIRHILRETICSTTAPLLDAVRRTCPAPPAGCATHQLPLHGPARPSYPEGLLVQELPAGDSQHPPLHLEVTWPEVWSTVPSVCPLCDSPTTADRYLNSSRGPGWQCTADPSHYWQVRLTPLRHYLAANPPQPCYPWYDTPEEERRAWLEAHRYPLRLSAVPLAAAAPGF